jgi:hypothetical protein
MQAKAMSSIGEAMIWRCVAKLPRYWAEKEKQQNPGTSQSLHRDTQTSSWGQLPEKQGCPPVGDIDLCEAHVILYDSPWTRSRSARGYWMKYDENVSSLPSKRETVMATQSTLRIEGCMMGSEGFVADSHWCAVAMP